MLIIELFWSNSIVSALLKSWEPRFPPHLRKDKLVSEKDTIPRKQQINLRINSLALTCYEKTIRVSRLVLLSLVFRIVIKEKELVTRMTLNRAKRDTVTW